MKLFLVSIFVLMCTNVFTQSLCARMELVKGIVVSRYSSNTGFYCKAETYIIFNNDTVRFYPKSRLNLILLKDYPDLKDSIGTYADFNNDYLHDFNNRIYKNDLTISDFDFHTEDMLGKVVKSLSFYHKSNSSDLYSVYQFAGTILFYTGINPFTIEDEKDCLCPIIKFDNRSFAILKEAVELNFITDEQVKTLKLTKSGIRSIEVFYCE